MSKCRLQKKNNWLPLVPLSNIIMSYLELHFYLLESIFNEQISSAKNGSLLFINLTNIMMSYFKIRLSPWKRISNFELARFLSGIQTFHASKNHLKDQHLIQQNERFSKAMNDYHKEVESYLKHLRESFAEIDEQAERLKLRKSTDIFWTKNERTWWNDEKT